MKHLLELANALYHQWLDISLQMQSEKSEMGMIVRPRVFLEQFEQLGKEARKQYEVFFKMGGQDATAFAQYADLSTETSDVCRDYILRALQLNPREPLANYMMGQMRLSEGDYQQAISHFQTAAEEAPTDPIYQNELGKTCFLMWRRENTDAKLLDCAIRAYEQAVRLQPQNNDWLFSAIVVLMEGGMIEKARQLGHEYLRRDPGSVDAQWIRNKVL